MTDNPPVKCATCAMYFDNKNLCAHLENEELHDLVGQARVFQLNRGDPIPDDLLQQKPILAVTGGEISLQYILHDGRRTIAAFFSRGDVLDLRDTRSQRLGSFIALAKVELCRLAPEVFDRIIDENPKARKLYWSQLKVQVERAHDHAVDLAKKKAQEKLASFILECSNRYLDRVVPEIVQIPMRRRDLAEYLGMQPETVSRCFKELEGREVIAVSETKVVRILNRPALRLIANGAGDGQENQRFTIFRLGA